MKITRKKTALKSTPEQIIDFITYHGQARAHDLHNSLHVSSVTVHKHLRSLVKNGQVKKAGKAPLVLYVLPHGTVKNHIQLEKIKRRVSPILKQARVQKAALFGSYVRGDHTKQSDIDLLVDLPEDATLIDLVGIKQDLEELLHTKVDVVTYNGLCPQLKESVLSNQYSIL